MNSSIDDLTNIIKSISYDSVISENEIEKINKWILLNRNKNLDYNKIIDNLDKILKNRKVTLSEKNEILNKINEIGKKNKLFQLNTLIEDIISSKNISIDDINKIKDWLKNNDDLVGITFFDKISSSISDINENNFNDTKQKQLMILFTFLLKDNKINQKINILKKMIESNNIIGNKLIELIDDNTIINKIHNRAIEQLKILLKSKCSAYKVDSSIIFLSLTLIALLDYDGNYYDYVADTYSKLYDEYSEQKIEGQIRNIINIYKNKTDNDYRIISLVLKNAIVPKHYLPSFFEFIFDIYRLNFNFSIEPNTNLYEEFMFVFNGIKKGLNYENDELNLKVTNKTYSLIKTTKDLILDDKGINDLIELSISILKIIDNYYWSSSDIELSNEYFKYGFDCWKEKTDKTIHEFKNKTSEFRSRWEPEYKLIDNNIYLMIPNHKIKDYYNYEDLKITIYNNYEILYENNRPDVYDIIGGYRIENGDILISKPLGKIRYVLSCNDEIIYDSKTKLYRDYIFFNTLGDELKNNRDYSGLVILCSNSKLEGFNIKQKLDNYILSYKNVNVGDYVKINNELFNFTTILNTGIIGIEKNAKVYINGKERIIYSSFEGIVYESEKKLDKIIILINNKRYKLSDLEVETKKRGLYNNYFIKLNLEDLEYKLKIQEFEDSDYVDKVKFNIVIDKNFDYKINNIDDDNYSVTINYLGKEYSKNISLNDDDINRIDIVENELIFLLPLNIPIYKLDNNKWNLLNDSSNYLWLKDLSTYSNLRINGIEVDKVRIIDENGDAKTTIYPSNQEYYYDISIGTIRSYESHDYVYIAFYKDDIKIGLLKVYCKCSIDKDKTKFWYDKEDNLYRGIISYFGKGNVIVNVYDELDNCIFESKVDNNEKIEIPYLESFKEYKLIIVDKKLGFSLEPSRTLYTKTIKYYNVKDFTGKYFQLYTADFNQTIAGIWQRKTTRLYNTYFEITKEVDDSNFIGNLYVYKGEKHYLNKLNPVEIELISDIDDGQIEALITKDGDGLFNDFEHHTILNEIDSRTAIDIYTYIINMERRR